MPNGQPLVVDFCSAPGGSTMLPLATDGFFCIAEYQGNKYARCDLSGEAGSPRSQSSPNTVCSDSDGDNAGWASHLIEQKTPFFKQC